MIKKTTKAIFKDGSYAGVYDWQGSIPLSEGEQITVTTANGERVAYNMQDKKVTLLDQGEAQVVHIEYTFVVTFQKLASKSY